MYERPEKRARLTLLDDNGPRVDIYDGVSPAICFLLFTFHVLDYMQEWDLRTMKDHLDFFTTRSVVTLIIKLLCFL